jgi:hypothetical protein
MSEFGSRWRNAVHAIKEQFQMPGPNMALDREPVEIRCDRSLPPADVVLGPDAQERLAPTWDEPPLSSARFSSYSSRATAETTSEI